jgi:hypothetical protein
MFTDIRSTWRVKMCLRFEVCGDEIGCFVSKLGQGRVGNVSRSVQI